MMATTEPLAPTSTPSPIVRQAVRGILLSSPEYRQLDPEQRRTLASLLVRVCHTAATLMQEETQNGQEVERLAAAQGLERVPPLARAQSAGSDFGGVAAQRVAGTTRAILNAVSFPAFVADLLNGVFKAITDNSIKQLQSYIDLLNNVTASTEGFADLNFASDRARAWLVEQFPSAFVLEGEEPEEDAGWGGEKEAPERRVALRPGASMPSEEALRAALGLEPGASVPSGDPDRALVPLVRQRLAKQRQEMLGTLVRLGMQRIVVDGGRIHAAMRFHIDTRSAAQAEAGSTFDWRNQLNASGSFGYGLWGASASMSNTIGYVSTQQSQTTEEMNTELDLNSSVEVIFRTDQVPLNRLATADQTARLLAQSRNPAEEERIYSEERRARAGQVATSEQQRQRTTAQLITPREPPAARPGEPGTAEAADQKRRQAAEQEQRKKGGAGKVAEGKVVAPKAAGQPAASGIGGASGAGGAGSTGRSQLASR
jgi:hypothetical protein